MKSILINNRICLKPIFWNEFYNLLVSNFIGKTISKPLILAAWNFTSDGEKLNRFKEHLSLVDFGSDNTLTAYLKGLKEENWHHENE